MLQRKTLLGVWKKGTSYLEFLFFLSDNGTNFCYVIKCWTEAWIATENTITKCPKCCQCPSKLSVSINYFVDYGNNIDCYSINTIFLCLIPRTQGQLLLSSMTESWQAIANVSISFADPHQWWETVFKVHLRSQLPNIISKCLGSCDKFITSKEWLLVNSYSSSTWRDPKTQE